MRVLVHVCLVVKADWVGICKGKSEPKSDVSPMYSAYSESRRLHRRLFDRQTLKSHHPLQVRTAKAAVVRHTQRWESFPRLGSEIGLHLKWRRKKRVRREIFVLMHDALLSERRKRKKFVAETQSNFFPCSAKLVFSSANVFFLPASSLFLQKPDTNKKKQTPPPPKQKFRFQN